MIFPAVAASWLTWAGVASGAERHTAAVEKLDAQSDLVEQDSHALLRRIAPGRAFPLRGEPAIQRYTDSIYWGMLGDHDREASSLFTLVTTGVLVERGLHRDAEWSLAEALFNAGNRATAEVRLETLLSDMEHPFRPDAVRLLLEIYARTARIDEFYQLYNAEIVSGRVRASDVVTYSVGRAFWLQGAFGRAEASRHFAMVPPESNYYARAQYFLGTIEVVEGDLASAVPIFTQVTRLSADTPEAADVRDLAVLALGRIAYEQSDFAVAATWYSQIAAESKVLSRALYELAWCQIKAEEYMKALDAISVYLLSYPNGAEAAELRVIEGQLQTLSSDWDGAVESFEKVVADYTPVEAQFAALARSDEDRSTYFARVVAIGYGPTEEVPEYARQLILADPDLSKAIQLFTDLDKQRTDIEFSEGLIRELEGALSEALALNPDEIKAEIVSTRQSLSRARLGALETEEAILAETNNRAVVEGLRARRLALGTDPAPHAVRDLRADFQTVSPRRSADLARLDEVHGSLDRSQDNLDDAESRLFSTEVADTARLQTVFENEVVNVAAERTDHAARLAEAQEVSVALTRQGFGRLEDLFGESVLNADMGIVDVFWEKKSETDDRKQELLRAKIQVLDDIDSRFELIRQSSGRE
ncbi:MAG: tetratricopeptide repeat protein [Deltaproteobacteria bacterium]|nr:tetratricopeptide repeat protein [Deltaproteobacteria bacterium]